MIPGESINTRRGAPGTTKGKKIVQGKHKKGLKNIYAPRQGLNAPFSFNLRMQAVKELGNSPWSGIASNSSGGNKYKVTW